MDKMKSGVQALNSGTVNHPTTPFKSENLFRLYCRKMDIMDEGEVNKQWDDIWKMFKDEESVVEYLYGLVYNESIPAASATSTYSASNDVNKLVIRNLVDSYYDIQKLRISTGNRVCASFKTQIGQKPGMSEDQTDKEAQKVISVLRKEYQRITDSIMNNGVTVKKAIEALNNDPQPLQYIRSKTDYDLMESYMFLQAAEDKTSSSVAEAVKKHPMWDAFFSKVKGCGPMMAGVCISYFDVNVARYASSFIAYAGIDPVVITTQDEDGNLIQKSEGHGKKHARDDLYKKKDNSWGVKKSIGYNPKLKSTLLSTLADGFLKAGFRREKDDDGKLIEGGWIQAEGYARAYAEYMHRLSNRYDSHETSQGRKHLMAKRYMIKCFLKDMWVVWRGLAGYDVGQPYEVAYLGKDPHHYNRYYTLPQKVYSSESDYEYFDD